MDAELKEKWIEALTSGRYPQTRGTLKRIEESDGYPVGFCCIGVLCDILGVGEWLEDSASTEGAVPFSMERSYGDDYYDDEYWPGRVEWFGEIESNEFLEEIGLSSSANSQLMSMNDDKGANFQEIAEYILENV